MMRLSIQASGEYQPRSCINDRSDKRWIRSQRDHPRAVLDMALTHRNASSLRQGK